MKRMLKRLLHPLYAPYEDLKKNITYNRQSIERLERSLNYLEKAVDILIAMPEYTAEERAEFNGQEKREEIFNRIMEDIRFDAIVETGTYVGCTAGYMATQTGLPVFSCEKDRRFYALARKRLKNIETVHIAHMQSTEYLKNLLRGPFTAKQVFFYLDAHWGDNLPLREEIETIIQRCEKYVMMIDDFKVPFDDGYGYDDYGHNASISFPLVTDLIQKNHLSAYFPNVPSHEETGARRGFILLSGCIDYAEVLDKIDLLRKYTQ